MSPAYAPDPVLMSENACGGCNLCCKLAYVPPPVNKPSGVMCGHCEAGTGCTIYDDRPAECSGFSCLWLASQILPEPMPAELKPDRCGVMFMIGSEPRTIEFDVDRMTHEAWQFISSAIRLGYTAKLATSYIGEPERAA